MGQFRRNDRNLIGEDNIIQIIIDGGSGGIAEVTNRRTGHTLIRQEEPIPWRMTPQGGGGDRLNPDFLPPSYEQRSPKPATVSIDVREGGRSASLHWETTTSGVSVSVTLTFGDEGEIALHPRIDVDDETLPPKHLTFPLIEAPRPLSENGQADALVFPYHSGWLIRNPLDQPPVSGPYPEGYAGCSMQFTAYFEESVGGFYIASHDPEATWKELNFGPTEWSFRHETWDLRRGTSIDYGFPIVIAALTEGDWFEAADRYREWAHSETDWVGRAEETRASQATDRTWIDDEVGLALWGTPNSVDWSPFYEFYAEMVDSPLHICSGWDWPASLPPALGKESWFPGRFHEENVAVWEDHYVTPYVNDLFVSSRTDQFLDRWEPALLFPYAQFSFDTFSTPGPDWIQGEAPDPDPAVTTDVDYFLCPATDELQDLHAWRASTLLREYPTDGVCYDISSGNPKDWSRCWRTEHGHPPGRGRELIQSYADLNRRTRTKTREQSGEFLVQGVETIIEPIIDSVDFYVARAGAGPLGALETWLPAPEQPPGTGRELIPLFEAVYHDIGPVRQDGWVTLAEDRGDLFYWIAARICLRWGGLLSLHYANNPPERPPGYDGVAEVVDWGGATQRFEDLPTPDMEKAEFIGTIAETRTELAPQYLSAGRMLRPLPIDPDHIPLDFSQSIEKHPGLANAGTWDVPAVVHGAWEAPDGSIGLLFATVDSEEHSVEVSVDCDDLWERDLRGRAVIRRTNGGDKQIGLVEPDNTLDLAVAVEERSICLLEIVD